jgi:hypothetical protein
MRIDTITLRGPNGHTATVVQVVNRGAVGTRITDQYGKTNTFYDEVSASNYIMRVIHDISASTQRTIIEQILPQLDVADWI